MLLIQTLLTEKQLQYDKMLQACWHLEWRELRLHQEAMNYLACEMQNLRYEVNVLLNIPKPDPKIRW